MMIRALLLATVVFSSPEVLAQSVIPLDTVDVGDGQQAQKMRDCLFDQKDCEATQGSPSSDISLDDVVNLGVIDRNEVSTVKSSDEEATNSKPLPSIDLEILFAYNSDGLTQSAQIKLIDLTKALSDPRLGDQRLVFIGHTDAIGSDAFNRELSQRRAESVANFVRATTGVSPSRVSAVGVGFTRLKNRLDPMAPENRRVQLVLVPM